MKIISIIQKYLELFKLLPFCSLRVWESILKSAFFINNTYHLHQKLLNFNRIQYFLFLFKITVSIDIKEV